MPDKRVSDALWFNALWFQGIWFSTVWGQASLLPVALALLAVHIFLVGDRLAEIRQMACVGAIGIGADALLSATGVYQFADNALVPLWLCCLWLAFAAVLGRSLAYLSGRLLLCGLAGAIAFPLNYWAGQRLGAVEFGYSVPVTLVILALVWGLLLPLMYRMTRLLNPASTAESGQ